MIGLLRVKNEARWIGRVIDSIRTVCDRILLMDDHSEDSTCEIAAEHGATVLVSPYADFNEASDKDWLLGQAWEAGAKIGDHVLMIDGDEALHPEDIPVLQSAVQSDVLCASLQIVYLWDREDQIRVDRWYHRFRRPSLFRLISRDLSFQRTGFGGNFHCSNVPDQVLPWAQSIPVRLLHYGYMHREDRLRKYEFYNKLDPGNETEDSYRHMVVGDLFPADSVFKHAGPLHLQPLAKAPSPEEQLTRHQQCV